MPCEGIPPYAWHLRSPLFDLEVVGERVECHRCPPMASAEVAPSRHVGGAGHPMVTSARHNILGCDNAPSFCGSGERSLARPCSLAPHCSPLVGAWRRWISPPACPPGVGSGLWDLGFLKGEDTGPGSTEVHRLLESPNFGATPQAVRDLERGRRPATRSNAPRPGQRAPDLCPDLQGGSLLPPRRP